LCLATSASAAFVNDETAGGSTFTQGTGSIAFTGGSGSEGASAPISATLTPGKTVTLTATVTAPTTLTFQSIRFGIFDDTPSPSPSIVNWNGYVAATGAGGPDGLYERVAAGGGKYYSVVTGANLLSPSFSPTGTASSAPPAGTYELSLSLTRIGTGLATDSISSTYSLVQTSGTGPASYSFTGSDTDMTVNSFAFDLNLTGTQPLKITFSNINVAVVAPEPGSTGLLGIAALGLIRRRQKRA
jgi:hypothetical protein